MEKINQANLNNTSGGNRWKSLAEDLDDLGVFILDKEAMNLLSSKGYSVSSAGADFTIFAKRPFWVGTREVLRNYYVKDSNGNPVNKAQMIELLGSENPNR